MREGVGERERVRGRGGERETMSYPNEHVAAKTLSSCSPSEANEHVDSVRRSRRTSPRMRGVIHTVKVKQSRTITAEMGHPRVSVLLCYLIGASKSLVHIREPRRRAMFLPCSCFLPLFLHSCIGSLCLPIRLDPLLPEHRK